MVNFILSVLVVANYFTFVGKLKINKTTTNLKNQNRRIKNFNKMEKITDLELLKKLVAGLKTLEDSQFKYRPFVSQYDRKNECGTVCCAWGWMPKFVPESGVRWVLEADGDVSHHPSDVLEIDGDLIDFMFYGYDFPTYLGEHDFDLFGDDYDSTLEQVINRIEFVIEKLEK